MPEINLYEELLQMRDHYNKKPLTDIKLNRLAWIDRKDPLYEIYEKKTAFLQNGQIVYGHIIQANKLLFKSFPRLDCPALVAFSADPGLVEQPEILGRLSYELYQYKNQDPEKVPEEWKDVARSITDEYDRSSFTLSTELNGRSAKYHVVTMIVYRKLLPKGKLCGSLLPVLTIQDCKQIMVLPKQYWTENYKKAWINGNI